MLYQGFVGREMPSVGCKGVGVHRLIVLCENLHENEKELTLERACAVRAPFLGSDNDDPCLATVTCILCQCKMQISPRVR